MDTNVRVNAKPSGGGRGWAAAAVALPALLLAGGAAQASTLTPIASYAGPPGSSTTVYDINDSGWMTGVIDFADGSSQGFSRDAAGVYTLFSVSGPGGGLNPGPGPSGAFTIARAIANDNSITGYSKVDGGANLKNDVTFLRTAGGLMNILINPQTNQPLHGVAQGQNSGGWIVGDFYPEATASDHRHQPFLLIPPGAGGGGILILDDHFDEEHTVVAGRGINDSLMVVGYGLNTTTGLDEGFVGPAPSANRWYSDPNSVLGTAFEDINNSGIIAGNWVDALGDAHAFQFDSNTRVFTEIDVPGATNTVSLGLNDAGLEVVTTDNPTGPNNFIFDPNGIPSSPPALPEPDTWGLMLAGIFAACAVMRRRRASRRGGGPPRLSQAATKGMPESGPRRA